MCYRLPFFTIKLTLNIVTINKNKKKTIARLFALNAIVILNLSIKSYIVSIEILYFRHKAQHNYLERVR